MTICVLLCRRALTAINQVCVLLKSCHMLSSDEAPRMYQNLKASTPQRSVRGYGTPGSCVRPIVCICVSILKKKEEMCVVLPGVLQLYEAQRSFNTGVFIG